MYDIVLLCLNMILDAILPEYHIRAIVIEQPIIAGIATVMCIVLVGLMIATKYQRRLLMPNSHAVQLRRLAMFIRRTTSMSQRLALFFGIGVLAQWSVQIEQSMFPIPTVFLVIDVSKSMTNAPLASPNNTVHTTRKIEVAKYFAEQCIDRVAKYGGEVGLICFSGEALTVSPATHDMRLLRTLLAGVDFGMLPDGTALHKALRLALSRARQSTEAQNAYHILVLTDGLVNIAPDFDDSVRDSMQSVTTPIDIFHIVSADDIQSAQFPSVQAQLSSVAQAYKGTYKKNPSVQDVEELMKNVLASRERKQATIIRVMNFNVSLLCTWGLILFACLYALGQIYLRKL